MKSLLLVLLLLCGWVPAQTVRVTNYSSTPYTGWVRATTDTPPAIDRGSLGVIDYALGPKIGLNTRVIDLWMTVQPSQLIEVSLAVTPGAPHLPIVQFPADPTSFFGGPITLNGQPMALVGLRVSGAAIEGRFRLRFGRMMCAEAWVTWAPDQPYIARGELLVTCSSPMVPDMGEILGQSVDLSFGDSLVAFLGKPLGRTAVASGTRFVDGMARAIPFTLIWTRHIHTPAEFNSVSTALAFGVHAEGISKLFADGNPRLPANWSAKLWAGERWTESIRRLHTWEVGVVGPNQNSKDTGWQEDQIYVGGEVLAPDGLGCEFIRYLGALKLFNRPCHLLEADGGQLNPSAHLEPRLLLWDGRVHWHSGVSPERMGKPRTLDVTEAFGWWGPDVEHPYYCTLTNTLKVTGSPVLQWEAANLAKIAMLQWTTSPGMSTTDTYSARAVGVFGMLCLNLYDVLEDRALAEKLKTHWVTYVNNVLLPKYGAKPNDIWDVRRDDRLGPGLRWIPWQQALGAEGVDRACAVLGPPAGREFALRGARAVLRDGFYQQNGRWMCFNNVAVDGGANDLDPLFWLFGTPGAVSTVLRHEPNEKAQQIWDRMVLDASELKQTSWLTPQ